MTLILDCGALIAIERADRAMWARLKHAVADGIPPVTHGGIVAQVWRGGRKQARLASVLPGLDIRPVDERLGRTAGELLARATSSDAIDAALASLVADGDVVLTSDTADVARLLAARGCRAEIIPV